MDLEDRITIATPEGVELQLTLAGLPSRCIAGAIDLAIVLALVLVVAIATGALGGGDLATAAFVVAAFVIVFFYDIAFEVLAGGRTPGKRWNGLRVVRDDGSPVDLQASAIRNLMRLIDGPLLLWIPTFIGIIVTRSNQRPGDQAAGTLVLRERGAGDRARRRAARKAARVQERAEKADKPASATPASAATPAPDTVIASDGWDVSGVSSEDLAAVRRFLDRRASLERRARERLAQRLEQGLRPKVAGAPAESDAEEFLEALAQMKASRG